MNVEHKLLTVGVDIDPMGIPDLVLQSTQPILLRGLVAEWPAVKAAATPESAVNYLLSYYQNASVGAWIGPPAIGGRFFYDEHLCGFNFQAQLVKLDGLLHELLRQASVAAPPAIYVGSTTVDTCLPGFRSANDIGLGERQALASIWIGNRARVAAHQDLPQNIACVVAGHRRFTLFPPDQLANLYIGPLDLTPAGQAISLVDIAYPDFKKFPRFAEALKSAQVFDLEPGDAIYIPSMWWHHVEALDTFNVLVNYWWRDTPDYMDSPMNALMLALMTVRDLPAEQRETWRGIFNHYVFDASEDKVAHIPATGRRMFAPLNADSARALRAQILKKLNR